MKKSKKGITLIALIITIIVLLILAGVALATLTKNGGIIENSNKSVEAFNRTASMDNSILEKLENKLKEYTGINNDQKGDDQKGDDQKTDDPKSDGSWDNIAKVNTPKLTEGMVAVYWSIDGGKTASTTQEGATEIYEKIDSNGKPSSNGTLNPNFNKNQWYEYVAGDNRVDTKTGRWANAVTEDGSYWVWIPRFKYKITELPTSVGLTTSGKIDVKFIPTTEKSGVTGYTTTTNSEGEMITKDSNEYIIHPAFENGSSTGKNNGYANGEWKKELSGFWMAKYEMSGEDENGNNIEPGNVALSSNVKMVSKPNLISWRTIQIGQIYQNCYNYDRAKESHLIKNSEWGAVAYLTHSEYGRNRNEITANNNQNYITGMADTAYSYNTSNGMLASTTGNIYGIYDMSGISWKFASGWNANTSDSALTTNGKAVDGTVYYSKNGASDEYKTVYSNETITQSGSKIKTVCRTGDGIKETWISGATSWFKDCSVFVRSIEPFTRRGGEGASSEGDSGVFSSTNLTGGAGNITSFFAVIITE